MAHKGSTGGTHTLRHTIFCGWCNERFEASREDAKTCSGKCRSRLARLVALTGFPPDEPPGPRSVQSVYLELVQLLLARERTRRVVAERERQQYLAIRSHT